MKKLFIILGIILIIFGVVYTRYMSDGLQPPTIVDQPIPLLDGSQTTATGTDTTATSTESAVVPTTQVDQAFPQAIIARETISQSLDTETKRIKGAYSFESLGAIKIGEFSQGVSGEVAISPDGIIAKNINGDTTFALDGATGDATFKGTVQSGSLLSGSLTVGGAANVDGAIHVLDSTNTEKVTIDKDGVLIQDGKLTIKDATNTTIIDATGLVSEANFQFDSVADASTQQTTQGSPYVDVTNMTLTFSLVRVARVLFMATVTGGANNVASGNGMYSIINVDGSQVGAVINVPGSPLTGGGVVYSNGSGQAVVSLGSGSHTVKLQFRSGSIGWNVGIENKFLCYLVLGK